MSRTGPRSIVLLGMVTKMPVPGVIWQTLQYMEGFRRLGYDVIYVEAHARTPSMFSTGPDDPGSRRAAAFLHDLFSRFGFGDRWAFHAVHEDGTCLGLDRGSLMRAYQSAELLINLHGGTRPRAEHTATGRLAYLGTDPCELEVELWRGLDATRDFLDAHSVYFTFGENYGRAGCQLPVTDRYELKPTRQPVVLDYWEGDLPDTGLYTTVANWRQDFREFRYQGDQYHWSKDREFRKIIDLPGRSGLRFELALSSLQVEDQSLLEGYGWRVRNAGAFSLEPGFYRDYVRRSRGELTVAKDQNVRLRSGWFSDRSATYLASGRPVVTQDTGFDVALPTGRGLFAFSTLDDAVAALEAIESDYRAACRAANEIARGHLDYRVVLPRLLTDAGVEGPARPTNVGGAGDGFPSSLGLEPESRRPMRLPRETLRHVLARPVPSGDGERPYGRGRPGPTESREDPLPAASVIVVTHEGLAFTRLCLETLLAHTTYPEFEVVVVDNGSEDGTTAYLRALASRYPALRLLLNPGNEGFARACNQGARAATGEVLIFLNNDTILAPGWLEALSAHLDEPGVDAVNPVTNRIGTAAEVADRPATYGEFLALAHARLLDRSGQRRRVEMLALFCLALRREVWDALGPLDEAFGRGLFEDDDYSARLEEAGRSMWCAEDVLVYHFGEASFGRLVPDGEYGKLFDRNREHFESKWRRSWQRNGRSGDDGEYGSLVQRIRRAVGGHVRKGATVAVVSRGDDELLRLDGASGRHFPSRADGTWAGHYPANGREAVDQLEAARRLGAEYLLVPRTGLWWLKHYRALERHLGRTGELVGVGDDFRLYRLGAPTARDVPRPVLIIGSPRSGTSVLTWSLGQHPNLYPLEETGWFGRFHTGLDEAFGIGTARGEFSQISAMEIERQRFFGAFGRTVDGLILAHRRWPGNDVRAGTAFARARSPEDPKERWVDGTPLNSFYVRSLAELFPEARFIHLLREPRKVIRSLRGFHRIGGTRHTAAEAHRIWVRHVRACLAAESALGPDRVLRVLHRDLATDPEPVVRACLEFVGEEYSPDCLRPLTQRINSSGTGSENDPEPSDAADPKIVAESEALAQELFGVAEAVG